MDQNQLFEQEKKCIQDDPPGCTSGCPVNADTRSMIAAIRDSDYSSGLEVFRKSVLFPGIISRICSQPCLKYCKRSELDDPISIRALEKICYDNGTVLPRNFIVPPLKSQKIAIIGAGLSGLTAAFELSQKGFRIEVFEAEGFTGGRIRSLSAGIIQQEIIDDDFSILEKLPVEIKLNTTVGVIPESDISFSDLCSEYDAVYIAAGSKERIIKESWFPGETGNDFTIDDQTLSTTISNVFAGGGLRNDPAGLSAIFSISDGKKAAVSIDRFLQNASLTANRVKEGSFETTLYTSTEGVVSRPVTPMSDPENGYNISEALQESERCLLCECLECVKVCEYLAHYKSYPKRYVREIYNNLSIVMGMHRANKMINSCSLCGLCAEVCPNNLHMGEICIEARRMMVDKGKMPQSAHDFALRDMAFSNSEEFLLNRHQPGTAASKTVFFPGCQLSASYPVHVKKLYQHLCKSLDGNVGLMLGCCGAPADWAGCENLFAETVSDFEQRWIDMGKPYVVTACPSCFFMLKQGIPDIPIETVWTVLDRAGLPGSDSEQKSPKKLAVHDSCTTRFEADIHTSVRNIIIKKGHQIEELPGNRHKTVCCGYGGLMIYANREVAHEVINKRVKESGTDYVSYCSMCRDNFAAHDKRSFHLLDLIFGAADDIAAEKISPGYSQRQENRSKLKKTMLRELWGEQVEEILPEVKIRVPENVQKVLEDRMILVSDISAVISYAEKTGNRLKNNDTGRYIAYHQPLKVTYWVEYSDEGDSFVIHNAYSHRMEITG